MAMESHEYIRPEYIASFLSFALVVIAGFSPHSFLNMTSSNRQNHTEQKQNHITCEKCAFNPVNIHSLEWHPKNVL